MENDLYKNTLHKIQTADKYNTYRKLDYCIYLYVNCINIKYPNNVGANPFMNRPHQKHRVTPKYSTCMTINSGTLDTANSPLSSSHNHGNAAVMKEQPLSCKQPQQLRCAS